MDNPITLERILKEAFVKVLTTKWDLSTSIALRKTFNQHEYKDIIKLIKSYRRDTSQAYEFINFWLQEESEYGGDETWISVKSTLRNTEHNTNNTIVIRGNLDFYEFKVEDMVELTIKLIEEVSLTERLYKRIHEAFVIETHPQQRRWFTFGENEEENEEQENNEEGMTITHGWAYTPNTNLGTAFMPPAPAAEE